MDLKKSGSSRELTREAAMINWARLQRSPVASVITLETGVLSTSLMPGANLTEGSMQCAAAVLAEALELITKRPLASAHSKQTGLRA